MTRYEGGQLRVAVVMLPALAKALSFFVEDLLQEETGATKNKRSARLPFCDYCSIDYC